MHWEGMTQEEVDSMGMKFRDKTRREWLGDPNNDLAQYMVVLMEMLHAESDHVFIGVYNKRLYINSNEGPYLPLLDTFIKTTKLKEYVLVNDLDDMPKDMEILVWVINIYK